MVEHLANLRDEKNKGGPSAVKSNGRVTHALNVDILVSEGSKDIQDGVGAVWKDLFAEVKTMAARGSNLEYIPPILKQGTPCAKLHSEEVH